MCSRWTIVLLAAILIALAAIIELYIAYGGFYD
jgi:hypothetical protein